MLMCDVLQERDA
jgi:hypothetical protein